MSELNAETLAELRESVDANQWHAPGRETVRALLAALAAEKAAREEWEEECDKWRSDYSDLLARVNDAEARAVKAEQERDEWQKAAEKHAEHARFMVEKSDHFERELAALRAHLERLERDESAAMDLWWRATDDDWAVPNWLPGRFLGEVRRHLTQKGAES